ncbi:MAG: hypothetical protein Q8R25_01360 [bacterium]|nr:hypothetical protein [bacterium]
MTLDALIMLFGAFVALLPFLGFPNDWDTVLLLITGIVIVALGIAVRRRMSKKNSGAAPQSHDPSTKL